MQRTLRSSTRLAKAQLSVIESKPAPIEVKPAPIADNWKLFRAIEKEHAPSKPRTKSAYKDNYAAGLAFPSAKQLFENKNDADTLLELSENLILEHAARRVDLFFYLLIAYYRKKIAPIAGFSRLQHGVGRGITQAAHSSFITSPLDKTILEKKPLTSEIENSNVKIQTSILDTLHFMDSLNQTIEVPVFVNELDSQIEFRRGARDKSCAIVREVEIGETIDPIQGLFKFLNLMKEIFAKMKDSENIFESKSALTNEFKLKVLALEEKGTFVNKLSKDGLSVNDDYIFMLLRLRPEEIALCKTNKVKRQKILTDKIGDIQTEIMAQPSVHLHRIKP